MNRKGDQIRVQPLLGIMALATLMNLVATLTRRLGQSLHRPAGSSHQSTFRDTKSSGS